MIEETDDILFTETLNKVFSKKFLAILTGKDAMLKEVRDCVIRNDPDRLQETSPYLFSYWRDLSVKHGCVCLDERIAIPKAIKDAGIIRLDQARCFTGKKFETFCTEKNFTPIYAPANDHRAIGLVERIIQTIKRQLSCMKSQLNKKFELENSLRAIKQQLRISK